MIERGDDRGEAVGVFSEQALRAPNGLNRRHFRAAKAYFARLPSGSSRLLLLLPLFELL
jgi:hypothetical protein